MNLFHSLASLGCMKVFNQHNRTIHQPRKRISELIEKLASDDDEIWPYDTWSPMRFKDGLEVGSKGGHGIIRYTIIEYDPEYGIKFQFTSPKGFIGTHEFMLTQINDNTTEVSHVIDMKTIGLATLQWLVFIRWLHDALIEDALDNIENHFSENRKASRWSPWVRLWRWVFLQVYKNKTRTSPSQNG